MGVKKNHVDIVDGLLLSSSYIHPHCFLITFPKKMISLDFVELEQR